MEISLQNIGLFYNSQCIFHNINFTFVSNRIYVCLGANGSGKSSLLKILSGYVLPTEGKVNLSKDEDDIQISSLKFYKHLSMVSPYVELFGEQTISETIDFIKNFKPFKQNIDFKMVFKDANLSDSLDKPIANLSSGQHQRLKLITSILADTAILLLDEPTSHLDAQGIDWYNNILKSNIKNRIVIIASNNNTHDFPIFTDKIELPKFNIINS